MKNILQDQGFKHVIRLGLALGLVVTAALTANSAHADLSSLSTSTSSTNSSLLQHGGGWTDRNLSPIDKGYIQFDQKYISDSQIITLQGKGRILGVLQLLGRQLMRGDSIESLVVIGSSAFGHGRLNILLNGRVISSQILSREIMTIQVPIRAMAGRDLHSLQLETDGNIQLVHIGLALEEDRFRRGPGHGPVTPGPRPPRY